MSPARQTLLQSIIHETVRESLLGLDRREWPVIPIHGIQRQFRESESIIRGFVGGRGCGKTFIGALDLMLRAKAERFYLVVARSFKDMKDSSFRTFLELSKKLGCYVSDNKSDFHVIIETQDGGTATVKFKSAHDPDSLRGPNVSGIWFDEASLMVEEAFNIAVACLREGGEMGWITLTFTPQGIGHWTYRTFFDKAGQPQSDAELCTARTVDNPYLADKFKAFLTSKIPKGSALARQELGGEFVDMGGSIFQKVWFRYADASPEDAARVRYWDKAGTPGSGDYSCGALLARGNGDRIWYVEDVVLGQWSSFERNRIMRETAKRDAAKYGNTVSIWVEQEPGSGGKESAQISVQELAEFPVYIDPVRTDKVTRSRAFASQAEAGNVRVLDGDWVDDFLIELAGFPDSEHDDQVDAICGAYNKLAQATGMGYDAPLLCYPSLADDQEEERRRAGVDSDAAYAGLAEHSAHVTREDHTTPDIIPADDWADALAGRHSDTPLRTDAPRATANEPVDEFDELLQFLASRARA